MADSISPEWVARKLASQPVGYVPTRLWHAVRSAWVRRTFPTAASLRRATVAVPEFMPLLAHLSDRKAPRWVWSPTDVLGIVGSVPDHRRARTVASARRLALRCFRFRGREEVRLAPAEWVPDGMSPGWVWDLNRHHWFSTLGFAYRYTGDEAFFTTFRTESSSWMDTYLHQLGSIGWDTPFEVASRLNAWLWAHFLFLGAGWDPVHHAAFVHGIGTLAEYLSEAIERHCPGNHVLLEAKALVLCGEALPELRGAGRWRARGWQILAGELTRQVCSDGVHAERSTMYHRIVAGELAELWVFGLRNGSEVSERLQQLVSGMAEFEAWIDQGSYELPLFGDAHREDSYYRFSARVACSAVLGGTAPELPSHATDHTYWLVGSAGIRFDHERPEMLNGGRAFRPGGYFVARSVGASGPDVLVWDCGPIGYDINRRHAHLDALSFTLALGGVPALIDPGIHESSDADDSLRRTRVHTTVSVDGQDQGVLAARGEVWRPARPRLRLWASQDDFTVMAGYHSGFGTRVKPIMHDRVVVVARGLYWLVLDSVIGSGEHLVEQRFHVAPQWSVQTDRRAAVIASGRVRLRLNWAQIGLGSPGTAADVDPGVHVESAHAELTCGRREQTAIIVASAVTSLPARFAVAMSTGQRYGDGVSVRWRGGDNSSPWLVVEGPGFVHEVFSSRNDHADPQLLGARDEPVRFAVIRSNGATGQRDMLIAPSSAKAASTNARSRPAEAFECVVMEPA